MAVPQNAGAAWQYHKTQVQRGSTFGNLATAIRLTQETHNQRIKQ